MKERSRYALYLHSPSFCIQSQSYTTLSFKGYLKLLVVFDFYRHTFELIFHSYFATIDID